MKETETDIKKEGKYFVHTKKNSNAFGRVTLFLCLRILYTIIFGL